MAHSSICKIRDLLFYIILCIFSTTKALALVYLDLGGGYGIGSWKDHANSSFQILPLKGSGGFEIGDSLSVGLGASYLWNTILMKKASRDYVGVLSGYGVEGVLGVGLGKAFQFRIVGNYLFKNQIFLETSSSNRVNGLEIGQTATYVYTGPAPVVVQIGLLWKQTDTKRKSGDSIQTGVGMEVGLANFTKVKESLASDNATVSPVLSTEESRLARLWYCALLLSAGYIF